MAASDDLPHTLVPLALAAELVYAEVCGAGFPGARAQADKLDPIATVISALVPIFEYRENPAEGARALTAADIAGGTFQRGAAELRFIDGRCTRYLLALSATDISYVVKLLKKDGS